MKNHQGRLKLSHLTVVAAVMVEQEVTETLSSAFELGRKGLGLNEMGTWQHQSRTSGQERNISNDGPTD